MPASKKTSPLPPDTKAQKNWLEETRAHHAAAFRKTGDVHAYLHALSADLDALIAHIAQAHIGKDICIIACGGYGRKEMFLYSDIDLLFLHHNDTDAAALAPLTDALLYALWDLGFKIGHAVRSLEDTLARAREDCTIRTSLLDMRPVCGDAALFTHLHDRLWSEVIESDQSGFIDAKLAERDARHERFGGSRYLLEPNLKDGKGGLRDLQTLYWLARHAYGIEGVQALVEMQLLSESEYQTYRESYSFLCTLRAHLHLCAAKPEERMTFDLQPQLAARLGYRAKEPHKAVEKMMKRYFTTAATVGSLTRIVCALLEEEKKRKPTLPLGWVLHYPWRLSGFTLDVQRLNVWTEDEFERDPVRMLELFHVAQEHQLDIHPHALRLVARSLHLVDDAFRRNKQANDIFLSILTSRQGPELTMRRMNEVGLLGAFIPDFGRINGQMQFNMYHIYTVDEHIIVALGILREIERGRLRAELPLATDLSHRIHSKRVLYLALFCHDIAKGREADHSDEGEKVATQLAKRFGFSREEVTTAGWLVKNHLILTHTAFKRDLNDPKTLRDLVDSVQTVERLRLLLVLTVADIRAVGPGVWNAWKGTLLRELYTRAERLIRTGHAEEPREYTRRLKQDLHVMLPHLPRHVVEDYLEQSPPALLGSYPPATHAKLVEIIREVEEGAPIAMDASHDLKRGISEIRLCTHDQPTLFAKLAGAFSLAGASIRSAQGFTLEGGLAIDIFQVQSADATAFDRPDRLARLSVKLEQAIEGTLHIEEGLSALKPSYPQRRDALKVSGEVFVENNASNVHTVIEVTAHDRPGLLHDIACALNKLKLTIASAHISTYGEQAVDVFYVKDAFGMKIVHEKMLENVRRCLLEAVEE